MKKVALIFIAGLCCLFSCQREIDDYIGNGTTPVDDTTGNNKGDTTNLLIGNWNFDSSRTQAQTSSVVTVDDITDSTISTQDYTTFGSNGTLTIDANYFKGVGFTYSISTTIHSITYQNHDSLTSFDLPIQFYLPPTNSTSKYQLISSDSVYFPEGGFFSTDTSSASNPTPYGMKYKIDGNMLTFTQHVTIDTLITVSDVIKHDRSDNIFYMYFHKK